MEFVDQPSISPRMRRSNMSGTFWSRSPGADESASPLDIRAISLVPTYREWDRPDPPRRATRENREIVQCVHGWHWPCSKGARSDPLTNDEPRDRAMAGEILSYFVRHPQAADTLEGVARWRLMDEAIRRKLHETEMALEWLVAQGFLTTSTSPGGTATFSLNAERAEEARSFLVRAGARGPRWSPP
jgi:hypothetical protein